MGVYFLGTDTWTFDYSTQQLLFPCEREWRGVFLKSSVDVQCNCIFENIIGAVSTQAVLRTRLSHSYARSHTHGV